jgi:formyl-CoA transferase
MFADPHFAAREAIVEVPHPEFGTVKMQNAFPKLSATPSGIRRPAPREVGQDNAEVYGRELGMGTAELEALRMAGVI